MAAGEGEEFWLWLRRAMERSTAEGEKCSVVGIGCL